MKNKTLNLSAILCPAFAILFVSAAVGAPKENYGEIDLIRDSWGIAHVYSDTDEGAMYGLGYAHAEDRSFQMYYFLRTIQGRLAEVIGDVATTDGKTTAVESDRLNRTMGFFRVAQTVADNLEPEARRFLEAYSEGVNGYLQESREDRHYLFDKYRLEPEPWTPAHSIVLWWHAAKWFAKNGLRDKIQDFDAAVETRGSAIILDETAVVRREDVDDEWIARVNAFLAQKGIEPKASQPDEPPKFSHAWVIGGKLSTTGAATLVSDPQTPVWNPSFIYEFHMSGKTFNARGAGVAGSPIILIGFNEHVAWGMTALGADQADLFVLKTDDAHPNQYFHDGRWREMRVSSETIEIRGGPPQQLTLSETHHGPIVTDFLVPASKRPAALRRVPMCEPDRDTVEAAIGMWRSKDVREFASSLPGWRFPTANVIFGDRQGDIGYWSLGALPVRSAKALAWGNLAHKGWDSSWEWQGMVPYDLLPHVINPKRGYLVSANHRTIQSFYGFPLGTNTGAAGDTDRGLRIKEKIAEHLQNERLFTPEDVLGIQYDGVNVAKREVVRLGFHLRDVLREELSPKAARALDHLEHWYRAGADSNTRVRGTELVNAMRFTFRRNVFPLADIYGGGVTGLAHFAQTISKRFLNNSNSKPEVTAEEKHFVNQVLATGWNQCVAKYGPNPEAWFSKAAEARQSEVLGYYTSLEHFPSLDPRFDVTAPNLRVTDGGTIWSQRAQSYTQYVPLHDTDSAKSILPMGLSERPRSPYRFSTVGGWATGELHPAPLSRDKVDEIAAGLKRLSDQVRPSLSSHRSRKAGEEIASEDEVEAFPGAGPPDDSFLDGAIREVFRMTDHKEVDAKVAEIVKYVSLNHGLSQQVIGTFQRIVYLDTHGTKYARQKMAGVIAKLGGQLPPRRPERFVLRQQKRMAERTQNQ